MSSIAGNAALVVVDICQVLSTIHHPIRTKCHRAKAIQMVHPIEDAKMVRRTPSLIRCASARTSSASGIAAAPFS